MKADVLFVTYGGGHVHMVYPVVHALRAREDFLARNFTIAVLALPAAKAILEKNDVPCFGFSDFIEPDQEADALRWGEELANTHHSADSGIDRQESVAYLGLNFKDLVLEHGESEARRRVEESGRQAFFPARTLRCLIERIQPGVVVATNSPRSEAAAISVANEQNISTLIMTDLFSGMGGYRLQASDITFLTERSRQMFGADGLLEASSSRHHIVGNPAFDRIINGAPAREKAWMERYFPGSGLAPVVVHADMPAYQNPVTKAAYFRSDAEILSELDAVYGAARYHGARYLIRPHPSQSLDLYRGWLSGKPHACLAVDCDLHELIVNASVVVARTTTVGLEAVYLGARVLQLDSDYHTDMPLANIGVAFGAPSREGLEKALGDALFNDSGFFRITQRAAEILPREPAAPKIADIIFKELTTQSRS